MKSIIIKNDYLAVEVFLLGAEVRSVKNIKNDHEYMWEGNPDIWASISPVLFPVVGRTLNGYITFANKNYPLGNHGFARQSVFKISSQKTDSITLTINTFKLDKNIFPFNLDFTVAYRLEKNKLVTTYEVVNQDTQLAYFSVGAHPAFKCPFDEAHNLEDYQIEFEAKQNLNLHSLDKNGLFAETSKVNIKTIQISKNTFDNDALIYSNFIKNTVKLSEKGSNRNIKVDFEEFPWLGIWSKPGASYICLEPWCGHADISGFNQEIQHKSGIEEINPGAKWKRRYSIEFGY